MHGQNDAPQSMAVLGPPLLAALSIMFFVLLPGQVLAILMAWSVVSLPIGILIGHCVLSEERGRSKSH